MPVSRAAPGAVKRGLPGELSWGSIQVPQKRQCVLPALSATDILSFPFSHGLHNLPARRQQLFDCDSLFVSHLIRVKVPQPNVDGSVDASLDGFDFDRVGIRENPYLLTFGGHIGRFRHLLQVDVRVFFSGELSSDSMRRLIEHLWKHVADRHPVDEFHSISEPCPNLTQGRRHFSRR